ncbi:MAG TPA: L,D-transpeptidase family protein [Chthoniobacterales bacterium]|nr:L,D-transpeptidase family protein [Chthoniobacterales bacterium]
MKWVAPRVLIAAAALLGAGCVPLPNDVGVHKHRPDAVRTRIASQHPIFATWNDDPALKGRPHIVINLTTQQAFFLRGKALVGKTNISSGRRDYETPPGRYRVIQKDATHVSNEYGVYEDGLGQVLVHNVEVGKTPEPEGAHFVGAPMPYFLRFTEGYGMHAGFVPRGRASHGCVRMPREMAKHFFDAAELGTRVEVIEPPASPTPSPSPTP